MQGGASKPVLTIHRLPVGVRSIELPTQRQWARTAILRSSCQSDDCILRTEVIVSWPPVQTTGLSAWITPEKASAVNQMMSFMASPVSRCRSPCSPAADDSRPEAGCCTDMSQHEQWLHITMYVPMIGRIVLGSRRAWHSRTATERGSRDEG